MRLERKVGVLSWHIDATFRIVVWIYPAGNEEPFNLIRQGSYDDGQRWNRQPRTAPRFSDGRHEKHNCLPLITHEKCHVSKLQQTAKMEILCKAKY